MNSKVRFFWACWFTFSLSSSSHVVLTGGTSTLGRYLLKHSLVSNQETHVSYRSRTKLLNIFPTRSNMLKPFHLDIMIPNNEKESFLDHFVWDSALLTTSHQLYSTIFETSQPSSLLLLNNAAVCLEGASPRAMAQSLLINTLLPYTMTMKLLELAPTTAHVTVVNISSGDGELVMLHSDLASRIAFLSSLKVGSAFPLCTHHLVVFGVGMANPRRSVVSFSPRDSSWIPRDQTN
jgi:hypothetical protein